MIVLTQVFPLNKIKKKSKNVKITQRRLFSFNFEFTWRTSKGNYLECGGGGGGCFSSCESLQKNPLQDFSFFLEKRKQN